MSAYIKDIFHLPESVHRGDFVLILSEGIKKAEATIKNYVVTEQLAACFDTALDVIKKGLDANNSKGCYLHGSFGSGKSHFMAILSLILQGNTKARAITELATVISKHNQWTEGKKFLIIPFHMIGKESIEQAVLGGYVHYIEKNHKDAPLPGVYKADELFKNASDFRTALGDDKFFARLNKNKSSASSGDWKSLDQEEFWDANTFENALNASYQSDDKIQLCGDLVKTFFSSVKTTSEFVDFDDGLSIISKHAESLGYDALILFLDELILWLATRAADVQFVHREGPKLAKLVETQVAERPIPIISFVARQRDLKELIGENVTGSEYVSFSDALDWWEARFASIKLEDKNLPEIAQKRILHPKSDHAKQLIDQAFEETSRIREEVMTVLLTSDADRNMFRHIYPFSPAFMNTLIAMSFLLQRERTALKVMLQVLIEKKDHMTLGEIIPVGDLYDAVSEGDEAVCDEVRRSFDNAIKLYEEKLKPLLESEHGITFKEAEDLKHDDPKRMHLKNDDRIVKTLLLAALAPNVEALRGLTIKRLTALNHGTIKSPIPGGESSIVLSKCRKWASQVGQIKISDSHNNPTVAIQLSGVDIESILDQAKSFDSQGNRIREIKKLLFQAFRIKEKDDLLNDHQFSWRGTKRDCKILFGNVREMSLSSFESKGDKWQIIIDWPFDHKNYGPKDDTAKLEAFQNQSTSGAYTIVWLPSFLSSGALNELGKFVIINQLLKGDHFASYTHHLTPSDRQTAKALLENQKSQLKQLMIRYLENAYGISTSHEDALDPQDNLELSEQFCSLKPDFDLRPPVGADLKQALDHILDQMFSYQYPGHPKFEDDIRLTPKSLGKIYHVIEKAIQSKDDRTSVEKNLRKEFRKLVIPLKIGMMGEAHFVLDHIWKDHFNKCGASRNDIFKVKHLYEWIEKPKPMGLPVLLKNLIIMTYASQTNRSFYLNGAAVSPEIDSLDPDMELKTIDLPSESHWKKAIDRAYDIFGTTPKQVRNASNVAELADSIVKIITENKEDCLSLPNVLSELTEKFLKSDETFPRLLSAKATHKLMNELGKLKGQKMIEKLAEWKNPNNKEHIISDAAMGSSLKNAGKMILAIRQWNWEWIESIEKLVKKNQEDAQNLLNRLNKAISSDEYVISLKSELKAIEKEAILIMQKAIDPPKPEPDEPEPPEPNPDIKKVLKKDEKDISQKELDATMKDIRKSLENYDQARIKLSWEIYQKR
jgi:hypothetical protein